MPLETAAHPEQLRRVVIEPLSRVEGHGKVTLLLDEDDHVQQARLHIVEFRGFEKFIQGRPYWEVPVMVQRLCGICPVSHHLAACKALDHGRRRDAAHAHGREDPPPDALRADPAVARAALLPPGVARPAVRLRLRRRAAQHRRRRGRASRTSRSRACCCASTARK
ncbi:MAG: nickel-dependent hydrogenase large subunit [Desulfobacterales bacterium]|nr:nickel-dependent hydrogenase large subunit [Desulfobacterales bacterium]